MLPVALGFGDGGKILQPLGIAVTSGLFFATSITIFLVPILLFKDEESVQDFIGNPKIDHFQNDNSIEEMSIQ